MWEPLRLSSHSRRGDAVLAYRRRWGLVLCALGRHHYVRRRAEHLGLSDDARGFYRVCARCGHAQVPRT